jgi:hypothetical protein
VKCQVIPTSDSSGHPFLFLYVFISLSGEYFLNSVGNISHPLSLTPLVIEISLVINIDETKYVSKPIILVCMEMERV